MSNTHIPKVLFVLLGVFGIAAIALFAYMSGRYSQPAVTNTNTTLPVEYINANEDAVEEDTKVKNTNTDEVVVDTITTSTEVNWLAEPERLENLNLLQYGYDDDQYYRIATIDDGGELIYVIHTEMGATISRFWKDSKGQYHLLANHSDSYYTSSLEETVVDTVSVNKDITYQELDYPDMLTVNDLSLSLYTYGLVFYSLRGNLDASDEAKLEAFGETPYGIIYLLQTDIDTTYDNGSIVAKKYILELADHSLISYADTFEFLADDGSLIAKTNTAGASFTDRTFFQGVVVSGCGVQGGNQYPVDMTPEALVEIGTTESGESLYTVTDSASSLLRNAYESYKVGRDYEGSAVDLLSYDEFVAATPVLLWQDAVGDYILFMDSDYIPAIECGKPLLYLYPTVPTQVSVKVGANVTVSEPAYNGGWNVLAQPTGTELFWEGKGWGTYPKITTGKVVASNLVEQTIREDLTTVGLNDREIADFLEFWLPHMPNTPYVRLAWLDTAQMNQLAPLAIKPRPDTLLRVFLDFTGQQTSDTTLMSQVLTTTPRNGFTVVEWGGLLLGQ